MTKHDTCAVIRNLIISELRARAGALSAVPRVLNLFSHRSEHLFDPERSGSIGDEGGQGAARSLKTEYVARVLSVPSGSSSHEPSETLTRKTPFRGGGPASFAVCQRCR